MKIAIANPKDLASLSEAQALLRVLDSGEYILGPETQGFEWDFAHYVGARHGVACMNGSIALYLALVAHGIGRDDRVIIPSFTFIATANAVRLVGAEPIFADIDPQTFNLSPNSVRKILVNNQSSRVKAIIPVHLYGQPADMDELEAIAQEYDLIIIEDACQAHGARYKTRMIGSCNTCCWSFYPSKNITGFGDLGMITTNDDDIADRLRLIRNNGSVGTYDFTAWGFNFRPSEFHAALARLQIAKLPDSLEVRTRNAQQYWSGLEYLPGLLAPPILFDRTHAWHQFTVRVLDKFPLTRDQLLQELKIKGIDARVYYPIPLHLSPIYREHNQLRLPHTEQAACNVLSLPVHPGITSKEISFVLSVLQKLYMKNLVT